jgi:hypothetical protein
MFTFFGLFADPVSDLSLRISQVWPSLHVIRLEEPISAIAVRFGRDHYEPEREDMPMPVVRATERISIDIPTARFLLLRAECYGGGDDCANWGQIIQNGSTIFQAEGDGALRRLIECWGVDIGPKEIFEPLSRSFVWDKN